MQETNPVFTVIISHNRNVRTLQLVSKT